MATLQRRGFLGWPGWRAIGKNMWDARAQAPLFPKKVWGWGWSFNFAYPTIRSKPFFARVLAFVIGIAVLLLLVYGLASIGLLLYYLATPPPPIEEQVIEIVLGP